MYIGKKSNKENDNTSSCSSWKDEEDAVLVDELKLAKKNGKHAQSGWPKQVWTSCEERMKKEFPEDPKSAGKCQEHWNGTLKKNFKAVHALITKGSGWGWDPIKKHVTATDDVWEAFGKAHPVKVVGTLDNHPSHTIQKSRLQENGLIKGNREIEK
ncbi:hypothetical protein D9758_009549 [Tetrapyrgos nigripes]|uniref:Myb/SANT-like domain-containing protein n=1 Tax=Tetrapyrgos nigripes TaxID=182062 RepID=A0A8H5G168_9AGAR|nr:hypothetical protein D9758_009549 [Tetrapyrgos nigripes]